ncbi:MAG TPA: hypothetical protein VM425_13995 [Myxococcota bacterium]|nr:hypothetical protein [Myxococcota bacterium]
MKCILDNMPYELHPGELVVLPVDGRAILHRARGPDPEPLVELPEDAYDFIVCETDRYAATLPTDPTAAYLYHVDWSSGDFQFTRWTPPEGHTTRCAAVTNTGVIYAGGGTNQTVPDVPFESMWIIRPGIHGLTTELIPLPQQVVGSGMRKRIDAMVLKDGRLIVVDNFLLPLWAFFYQVQPDGSVHEEAVIELEPHSTYEHVNRAVLGERFIALLSQSANHGRTSQHISVRDPATLDEIYTFTQSLGSDRDHTAAPVKHWSRMAFSRDLLFVAAIDQGLGVIDLGKKKPALKYRSFRGQRVLAVTTACSQHGCYVNLHRKGHLPTFQWIPAE